MNGHSSKLNQFALQNLTKLKLLSRYRVEVFHEPFIVCFGATQRDRFD